MNLKPKGLTPPLEQERRPIDFSRTRKILGKGIETQLRERFPEGMATRDEHFLFVMRATAHSIPKGSRNKE